MSRSNTFFSLGVMPALMGMGHLVPVLGAIQTATGSYQFPWRLLGLIGTISALVDAVDTYKDVALVDRPRKWIWKTWLYAMWAIVAVCTALSGLQTAILIYRVLPLGLLWGAPCIPSFSRTDGLALTKPKTLLGEAKSLVVALCMASVCCEASMAYYCSADGAQCSDEGLRRKSFYLAILYQFFRETSCDIRDIKEDTEEGLETLPVRLGKWNTLLLMTIVGIIGDAILTGGVMMNHETIAFDPNKLARTSIRILFTMAAYIVILRYPRHHQLAWGTMSLCGLAPVLFAQAALRN